MTVLSIPFVGWGWGFAWIGFFGLLCVGMSIFVYRLVRTGKSKEELGKEEEEEE